MTVDDIEVFLKFLGVNQVWKGEDWVTSSCPLAPWTHKSGTDTNPSFGVKADPNANDSPYNCWACGGGHSITHLIATMRMRGAKPPKYNLAGATDFFASRDYPFSLDILPFDKAGDAPLVDQIFPEEWLQSFARAEVVPDAVDYLASRNVNLDTCKGFDIRWDSKRKAVAFPIFSIDGKCLGLHGRYVNPPTNDKGTKIRYHSYGFGPDSNIRNKHAWYGEWYLREDIPVIMVESVFDTVSVSRVYPNVIAPLSAGMNADKIKRIKYRVGEILTFFDFGEAGDMARNKIDSVFNGQVLHHCIPTDTRDPGDMTVAELKEHIDPWI